MSDPYISKAKSDQLTRRMKELGVSESDITEKFVLGSGKGGQKVNKTSSCVHLRHAPTGIEMKCGSERSRSINRYLARKKLCDRIDEQVHGVESAKRKREEKIRRQKRRRSRRQKARMLDEKRTQGEKKKLRARVELEE